MSNDSLDAKLLDPLSALTLEQKKFVYAMEIANLDSETAFIESGIYKPDHIEQLRKGRNGDKALREEINRFLKKTAIKKAIAHIRRPASDIAEELYRQAMLFGATENVRMSAAKFIADRDMKRNHAEGAKAWARTMIEIGATVEKTVPLGAKTVTVSMEDLVSGEARVRLDPKAKKKLLELAGAPWNDRLPGAKLSELQIELLARRERDMIVHGGSGVGKSVTAGCELFCGLVIPNAKLADAGANYDHAAKEFAYVHKAFMKMFGQDGATSEAFVNKKNHHDMHIYTIWGATLDAFSVDRAEGASLLGNEFDILVCAEGSQIAADTLDRKALRALDRRAKNEKRCGCNNSTCDENTRPDHYYLHETGRLIIFTTPNHYDGCSAARWEFHSARCRGDFEKLHVGKGLPWLETAYLREAKCIENPSYSKAVYESRRKTLPRDVFEEQYEGKMTRRAGIVYKEFDPETHIKRAGIDALRRMKFGLGIDTGKNFAALLLGIEPDCKKWVLGEVYTKEQSLRENALDVIDMVKTVLAPATGSMNWEQLRDLIHVCYADPASQHKEDLYEELGVPILFEQQELLGSIDKVRTWIEEKELFFHEDGLHDELEGVGIIWEMKRYQWKKTRVGDSTRSANEPVKREDHALDALRIGMVPLDASGPPIIEDLKVRTFGEVYHAAQQRTMLDAMRAGMKGQSRTGNMYNDYRRIHG